jgi:hypothetical protein
MKKDVKYPLKSQRAIVKLLKTFGTIPLELIEKYVVSICEDYYAKRALLALTESNVIYYDKQDMYYKLYRGMEKDPAAACAFRVYLKLGKSGDHRVAKAAYPFDYIFEEKDTLYQIINCSDRGIFKLNFRKQMEVETPDTYQVTPILMFVNESERNVLGQTDYDGRYFLIPKEDYLIAHVTYIPGRPDQFDIRIRKCTGGTTNGYTETNRK